MNSNLPSSALVSKVPEKSQKRSKAVKLTNFYLSEMTNIEAKMNICSCRQMYKIWFDIISAVHLSFMLSFIDDEAILFHKSQTLWPSITISESMKESRYN